jgi:hypothetical protein
MMWVRATLALVAVGFVFAATAVAAPNKVNDGVGFGGLDASCPGFSTPEVIPNGLGELTDLWLDATWRSVISDTGLKTTTLKAKGTDGAGVKFSVEASFSVQGSFVEGIGWVFSSPLFLGTGPVTVTRKDGATVIGLGSMDFSRGGNHWGVGVAGDCGS